MIAISFYPIVRIYIYGKIVLSNKISYCVRELLPFCDFLSVRYSQRYQLRLQPLLTLEAFVDHRYDLFRQVQKHTLKQNGCPGGFCSSIKNCPCYHFVIYPMNESCSQTFLRRIMLLRSLITILLVSYK